MRFEQQARTEEAKSIVVVNNLLGSKSFNTLVASTLEWYLTSAKQDIPVNFIRHNEIVSSLGLLGLQD